MSGFFGGGGGGATASSLDTRTVVADQAARFALTTDEVQNGDTVYQTDTAALYLVIDDTNLDSATGYHLLPPAGVKYAASGAGTQNYLQVPNASGDLINSAVDHFQNGLRLNSNLGASVTGHSGVFKSSLGMYYNTAGNDRHIFAAGSTYGTGYFAGAMISAGSNSPVTPGRALEVRDNSGNPQQRWAYDASNYTDGQTDSNGHFYVRPSGNRVYWYSTGGSYLSANFSSGVQLNGVGGQFLIQQGGTTRITVGSTGVVFSGNVAFFGGAQASQQAHIADADGTLSGNQAAINAILVALENYGLLAAS